MLLKIYLKFKIKRAIVEYRYRKNALPYFSKNFNGYIFPQIWKVEPFPFLCYKQICAGVVCNDLYNNLTVTMYRKRLNGLVPTTERTYAFFEIFRLAEEKSAILRLL
jgi:hypothetical protein